MNVDSKKFLYDLEKAFPLFNETELKMHIQLFKEFNELENENKTLLKCYKNE